VPPPTLILFPTARERDGVLARGPLRGEPIVEVCGFGPIAAAARATQLMGRRPVGRVVLVGIAGTYDETRLPVGAAAWFDSVWSDGVGAGQGAAFVGPAALGLPQWPGSADTTVVPIHDRLGLLRPVAAAPRSATDPERTLVTVCAASASPAEAARRCAAYPGVVAEDMEGFAGALACVLPGIPVALLRGLSDLAGDRGHGRWRIDDALDAAADRLYEVLT